MSSRHSVTDRGLSMKHRRSAAAAEADHNTTDKNTGGSCFRLVPLGPGGEDSGTFESTIGPFIGQRCRATDQQNVPGANTAS